MTINFSNKWIKVALHIIVWAALISLPYVIDVNRSRPPRLLTETEEAQFLRLNFISYIYWIAVFYLNSKVLIPSLFYKKKYLLYGLCVMACLLFAVILHAVFFAIILLPDFDFSLTKTLWFNAPTLLLTIAASTAFTMISDRISEENRALQREQENMKTELSFLRSQISPHFIFNILNNIVALVRLKSNELEPTVMKLSGLLQYMLYETDEEKVSIKTETEYLQAYIDLQKQRFGKKVDISTSIQIENEFDEIEPMLLIPFIENAFKHGVGTIDDPQISVDILTVDGNLTFSVKNKYSTDINDAKDPASGIGLANVSRRLNLLYGINHHLSIEKDNEWFNVMLTLKLT